MDVASDSDGASSYSNSSDGSALSDLQTGELPIQDAIAPLPEMLRPEMIQSVSAGNQEVVLGRVADVNIRMATLMADFLRLVKPPRSSEDGAAARLHDPTGCVELSKLLETRPALALEEQYEDFGIWRAIQRASVSLFEDASQQLERVGSAAPAEAGATDGSGSAALTLADVLRTSTATHCQDELEHVRQEPHVTQSKLSSLLGALESGADLLKPTEEFWLRKK